MQIIDVILQAKKLVAKNYMYIKGVKKNVRAE